MPTKLKKPVLTMMVPETTEWQYVAVCAIYRGDATPEQQIAGMNWIIKNASGFGDLCFDENSAIMAFNDGRHYVGKLIVRMLTEDRDTFITLKEKKHG